MNSLQINREQKDHSGFQVINEQNQRSLWEYLNTINFKYTDVSKYKDMKVKSLESLKTSFINFCQESQLISILNEETEIFFNIEDLFNETIIHILKDTLMESTCIKDLNEDKRQFIQKLYEQSCLKVKSYTFVDELSKEVENWENQFIQENQNTQIILNQQITKESSEQNKFLVDYQIQNQDSLIQKQNTELYQNQSDFQNQNNSNQKQEYNLTISKDQKGYAEQILIEKETPISNLQPPQYENKSDTQSQQDNTIQNNQSFKQMVQGQIQQESIVFDDNQPNSNLQNTPSQDLNESEKNDSDKEDDLKQQVNNLQDNYLSNQNLQHHSIPDQKLINMINVEQLKQGGQLDQESLSNQQIQQESPILSLNEQSTLINNQQQFQQNEQIIIAMQIIKQKEKGEGSQQIQNEIYKDENNQQNRNQATPNINYNSQEHFSNQFEKIDSRTYSLLENLNNTQINEIQQSRIDECKDQNVILNQHNQQIQNDKLINSILIKIQQSKWVSQKYIEDFTNNIFESIKNQDWESIDELIEEFCLPKFIKEASSYLKEQIDLLQEKTRGRDRQIIFLLQNLPQFSQFPDKKISKVLCNLKEKGFDQDIKMELAKEIFAIELKYPFICKQDSYLLKLYLESNQKKNFILNTKQLNTIKQYGFDLIIKLSQEFQFNEIEDLQNNIESSNETQKYLDQLNLIKFIPRLHNAISLLKNKQINSFNKNEIEENFIFSYDKFKVISEEIYEQKKQQFFSDSSYLKDLTTFFSKDVLQNIYIRCLILCELRSKSNKLYFKEVFSFIKLLQDNPEIFVQIWAKKNSSHADEFLKILLQEIDLFDDQNQNGLKLDIIKILIGNENSKKILLKTIFENLLKCFNLGSKKMNELFDQFSYHGLNYFEQIEDIVEIKQIQRQLKKNKLLKFVFGNDFYETKLLFKETYVNFQQLVEQANYLDLFFKQSYQRKMVIDDFMKFIHEDQSLMIIQIKDAVDDLKSEQNNIFIEKIFYILIQLSKRNQDLSSVFHILYSELRKQNININLINSKILTEYLFMSVDNEVSSKLTYLLGYSNPIPLIISRPNSNNQLIEQKIMKNVYWLLSYDDNIVASIGFGYQRGKSEFLNEIFLTNFEISNKSYVFQGSADIQSNKYFKTDKRDYFVVDFHGDCLEVEEHYFVGSYKFYIIQINYSFLNSKQFNKVIDICNKIDSTFKKICFIIRDYLEPRSNLKDFFDINITRQKLGCEFFMDKQVFILPNLKKQERDDKNFIISQSRTYLNELIVGSNQTSNSSNRELFSQNILTKDDEEYKIKSHVENICQKLSQFDLNSKSLFTIYPLFKQYSRNKQKLARKHFLQNQDREQKQEETDLDRIFYDNTVIYNNFIINEDNQRSQASYLFEQIICSQFNLHNTMTYFIKELRLINQIRLQDLILEKHNLSTEISKLSQQKNQNQFQIKDLDQKIDKINMDIEDNSITVEILWREIIQTYLKHTNYNNNQKILDAYRKLIDKGFPFEIIDGENFYFPKQFLTDVFDCYLFKDKKICVVSIIGPQNSGKSTLLNFLLGCDFSVSDGRCTKGIYGTLIKSKVPEFDLILVIDSEGLQSLEKNDSEYDRKITLFCLSISHLVIINIKDQLTNEMLLLLEVCISSRQNIEANTIQKPIIEIVFNQTADPNQNNAQQAIDNALKSFDSNKLLSEIEISKENVTFLPNAVTSEVVIVGGERQLQWRYLKTQVDFVERVKKLGYNIFDKLLKNFKQSCQLSFKNIVENINQWIDIASILQETISLHPSLTSFKDIKEKQVDSKLKEYIKNQIDIYFNQKLTEKIEKETENKNIADSEWFIRRTCDDNYQQILKGYNIFFKTFVFDVDDLYERNKHYIINQIESFKINYINDLKMNKNMIKIHNTLNQSIITFEKKIKYLKTNNVTKTDAENEFEELFREELNAIQKNIPTQEQTKKDALQFVSDQYKRYCQCELLFDEDIKKLIDGKDIFHQNNQYADNQKSYVFTNESFESHFKNLFNNSLINTIKLLNYFQTSKQLIDIAFQKSQKLNYFSKKITKCKKKTQCNQNQSYQYSCNITNNWSINSLYPNNQLQILQQQHYNNNFNQEDVKNQKNNQITQSKLQQEKQYQNSNENNSQLGNISETQQHIQFEYETDKKKIEDYNNALKILNLKVDPSYIQSQIESNINNLNDKQKLIIEGKEKFIVILNLNVTKELDDLKQDFIREVNNLGWFRYKFQQIFKKNKKNKISIQYWKPFVQWVRIYLQNNTNQQDIIDIKNQVDRIKSNLQNKVFNKKVNEELIQAICGYVNDEIKQQEDLIEIFNIKFTQNFKSYIHGLALNTLYNQESLNRNLYLIKPIKDFESKKNERKQLFIQKFEAQNNINQSSSVIFYQFLKEFSKKYIDNILKEQLNQINDKNEKEISRYGLQILVDASLANFSTYEANDYVYQPLYLINKILEQKQKGEMDSLIQIQKNSIQLLISAINDIKLQLHDLNQGIESQLSFNCENDQNNQDNCHILKRIKQNDHISDNINTQEMRKSMSETIENYNCEIEENKMKTFSNYIFNKLIGCQTQIFVNNIEFNIELNIPLLYSLKKQHFFMIEEFKQHDLFKQIQIYNLTEFIQCFNLKFNDLKNFISQIDIILNNNLKDQLSQFNQRVVSCTAKCPCCDQICDQDHWKFKGIPIGEQENKHQSKSGHRFVAFRGVKIERLNQPALILCSDYKDQDLIIHKNQKMYWKTFKQNNPEWNWNFIATGDPILERAKWSCLWKIVGREICNKYSIQNYVEKMSAEQIELNKKQPKDMHFLFVFDESSSMNNEPFKGLYQSLVRFMNERVNQIQSSFSCDICSLLGFNKSVTNHAQYEEISPQTINKIPKINKGGLTCFKTALNGVSAILAQKRDYDQNIVIIFLSDGEDSLPEKEVKELNSQYKGRIKHFWTIGYGSGKFDILKKMAELLKDCGGQYKQSLDSNQLDQEFQKLAYIIPN